MAFVGSFFLTSAVLFLPAQAVREDCSVGSFHDFFATVQEMVLLIAAFTIGWHLIGPFLGVVFRQSRAIARCTSRSPTPSFPSAEEVASPSASSEGSSDEQQAFSFPSDRPDLAVDHWICLAATAEAFAEPQLYARVFEACVQAGDFDSAHRLAKQAAWTVPAGPRGASNVLALARWLARRQNLEAAEQCLKQVREAGAAVDLRTMKSIIVVCAQLGRMDMGREVFDRLAVDNLRPDFAIYSAMIRGLCNVGKVEEALAYLERMHQSTILPDAMMFDVLLEGCVQQNFFKGAENLLSQMKELGMQPSNATLAACIRLYSSRGDLNRAMTMFQEMSHEYHLLPNACVYGALIAACVRNGKPELALSIHEQMAAVGCLPSARNYEQLIQCCMQLGWTARAVEVLDEALGLRCPPAPARPTARPRTFIDPKVVEDLLALLARRKQVSSLGLALLKRLEEVDFDLPETRNLHAAAKAEREGTASPSAAVRCWRRRDFDNWRNFTAAA
mmetsp:Transcript_55015/g.103074  ORF Transcript_55015/g.103074 Transcript_55015/m.103074 type:complete len:503 (-) Transcript_55015:250-1758(-)